MGRALFSLCAGISLWTSCKPAGEPAYPYGPPPEAAAPAPLNLVPLNAEAAAAPEPSDVPAEPAAEVSPTPPLAALPKGRRAFQRYIDRPLVAPIPNEAGGGVARATFRGDGRFEQREQSPQTGVSAHRTGTFRVQDDRIVLEYLETAERPVKGGGSRSEDTTGVDSLAWEMLPGAELRIGELVYTLGE